MLQTHTSEATWPAIQWALADVSGRFVALLRSLPEGDRRAIGHWSIGETAAHALVAVYVDGAVLAGAEVPSGLAGMRDRMLEVVSVGDVAAFTADTLAAEPERRPAQLAARIEAALGGWLPNLGSLDPTALVPWLG